MIAVTALRSAPPLRHHRGLDLPTLQRSWLDPSAAYKTPFAFKFRQCILQPPPFDLFHQFPISTCYRHNVHRAHQVSPLFRHFIPQHTRSNCSPPLSRKTYTLNTGDKIPAIGLGTWQSKPNEVREAVKNALLKGYRHIDTALAYGNEAEVGAGIRDSGVPRDQIWLTTKLDNTWHHQVEKGIESSLKDLGVDYVDLYLMHWPSSTDPEDKSKHLPDWNFIKTW